jgi:hypothetical protein
MKVYLCSLLLSMGISLYINAQASTCDCKSDLIYLNQKIKTLPSTKKTKPPTREHTIRRFQKHPMKHLITIVLNY